MLVNRGFLKKVLLKKQHTFLTNYFYKDLLYIFLSEINYSVNYTDKYYLQQ